MQSGLVAGVQQLLHLFKMSVSLVKCYGECLAQCCAGAYYRRDATHDCVPQPCPNFEFCKYKGPVRWMQCHNGLCHPCNMLAGALQFSTGTCALCKKAGVRLAKFPRCDHRLCLECLPPFTFLPYPTGVGELHSHDKAWEQEQVRLGEEEMRLEEARDKRIEEGTATESDVKWQQEITAENLAEDEREAAAERQPIGCPMCRERLLRDRHLVVRPADCKSMERIVVELRDDDSGFGKNAAAVLRGFKEGRLFVAHHKKNRSTTTRAQARELQDPVYCGDAVYQLPAFCLLSEDRTAVAMLWVHARARRLGIATAFVEHTGAQFVEWPLTSASQPFWDAVGLPLRGEPSWYAASSMCD